MSIQHTSQLSCVIIGASHAGVNCAFSLRREGWEGRIILLDGDPQLPYHRPPLSKSYLNNGAENQASLLMPAESYQKESIRLKLGHWVKAIEPESKTLTLEDGTFISYDKLVLATGAQPIIPTIPGIDKARNIFPLRTAQHALNIRSALQKSQHKQVVVIGGGYIGLEAAASLKKLGAEVSVLEREERILARVTSPEMSSFYQELHKQNGVSVFTKKNVISIENIDGYNGITCADGTGYLADIIIVGVGVRANTTLAEKAGLTLENGIVVDGSTQTSKEDIYAIGDCTFHHNPYYNRFLRLESVQNAVDQAKVAAAAICGKSPNYDVIPWFWSDQYDVKLQMVGLSRGYDQALIRNETDKENCFSVWYFKDDVLLAVDAVNHPKAYVLGTKFIKSDQKIDKFKLVDASVPFKPNNFLMQTVS